MNDSVLDNIEWHLEQISLFVALAKKVPTKSRSPYYKACFIFGSSIVEALTYHIIKQFHDRGGKIELRKEEKFSYKKICILSNEYQKIDIPNQKIIVGTQIENSFSWKEDISFRRLNDIGRQNNIFKNRMYTRLEKIRKKRNHIHLQELIEKDDKYSKKDINDIGKVITGLVKII